MPQTKKTGKTPAKKKTATKSKPKTDRSKGGENSFFSHAAPFIIVALAVLVAVCVIVDEGVVGKGIRGVLCGLFGGGAYALPLFLLVRALFWNRDREEQRNVGRTSATAIEVLLLCMLLHFIFARESAVPVLRTLDAKVLWSEGARLTGGGVTGGILGELMRRGFGPAFSVIVLSIAMLLLALYIAGLTPRGAAAAIAYHASRLAEKRRERKARKEEIKQNLAPTKNQVKEEEYLAWLREKKRRQREAAQQRVVTEPADPQLRMQFPAPAPKKKKSGEIYHVRKRRLTELDIPVSGPAEEREDENLIPIRDRKTKADDPAPKTGWAADAFRDPDEPADETTEELASPAVDSDAIDEKIFDEVMRRTRERVEKSKKENELREGRGKAAAAKPGRTGAVREDAGDFLPADQGAEARDAGNLDHALGLAEGLREQERAHALPDETDTVSLATAGEGEFDVKDIFVHPEDAQLIEKLSQQYQNPLEVQRKTVSEPAKSPEKPVKPEYKFPPCDLLTPDAGPANEDIRDELEENAVKLVETLRSCRVRALLDYTSRRPSDP